MKKIISLSIVVLLTLGLFSGCNAVYSAKEDNTIMIDGYSYADDSIIVIINEGYTDKKYTPADFDKNLVRSVKVILENLSGELKLGLALELRNPGEENIMKLIEIAQAKPEVMYAHPSQVVSVDLGVSE